MLVLPDDEGIVGHAPTARRDTKYRIGDQAMRDRFGFVSLLPYLQQNGGQGGGSGESGSSGTNGDPSGNSGTNDDPQPGTGEGGSDPPQPRPQPFAVFETQDQFNNRLNRAVRSRLDEQAKQQGYNSHQELLDAAKAQKEREQSEQDELTQERTKREQAEADRDRIIQEARDDRLRARVERLSTTDDEKIRERLPKIVDPETAFQLMDRSEIEFTESGEITGVEDALVKLINDKPYLKVAPTAPEHAVPASPKPAPKQGSERVVDRYLAGRYGSRSDS